MKVSTKLFNQQQLKQFSTLNEEIQTTQNKISTGRNILRASDDPVGSVELSGLKIIKDRITQFEKNIESSSERLTLLDKNLENYIKFASEHGFIDIMLNTNGTLLTEERARKFLKSGVDTRV